MVKKNKIQVFWWSSVKFENKPQENFGDILSKYLVEKISGRNVVWKHPKKREWNPFKQEVYFTTGSILAHVTKNCIVWGSGIISKNDKVDKAVFLAVRGPETYNYLINKGYSVQKVFGDPAIVLPYYYKPEVKKKYELGIIPHYIDYSNVSEWYKGDNSVKLINLLSNDIEEVIDEILSCKQILSSSLHGLIVSHTYNIPAVWVEFSDKLSGDGVKFLDYFKSVGIEPYKPDQYSGKINIILVKEMFSKQESLPEQGTINKLSIKLLSVCPFKV